MSYTKVKHFKTISSHEVLISYLRDTHGHPFLTVLLSAEEFHFIQHSWFLVITHKQLYNPLSNTHWSMLATVKEKIMTKTLAHLLTMNTTTAKLPKRLN